MSVRPTGFGEKSNRILSVEQNTVRSCEYDVSLESAVLRAGNACGRTAAIW